MIDRARSPASTGPTVGTPGSAGRREQEHLDAERARRSDLAIGGAAAAVLGDDRVDAMLFQQRSLVGLGERPARQNVGRIRNAERRLDRIDAADDIGMLRRAPRKRRSPAARAPGRRGAARHPAPPTASSDAGHLASSGRLRPASQAGRRSATSGTPAMPAASAALCRDARRIGMRRIDQQIDAVVASDSAARPSAPPKPPLITGTACATGLIVRPASDSVTDSRASRGQPLGQLPRFASCRRG